jgi:hypothetical protein
MQYHDIFSFSPGLDKLHCFIFKLVVYYCKSWLHRKHCAGNSGWICPVKNTPNHVLADCHHVVFLFHFPTLIPPSGVDTTCFLNHDDSVVIFTNGRLNSLSAADVYIRQIL